MPFNVNPLILPRLVIWAVLLGVLSYTVADPDLWGHVRFGVDILRQQGLPAVDPYSFTSHRPWINHEWLAEVGMAAAYLAAGPVGLSILKLLLLLTTFGLVWRELASRGVPPIAQDVLLAVCIIGCLTLTRTVRPQTFSLAIFAGLLVGLRRIEDGRGGPHWWLLPVAMAIWANLHGGWLVGAGVLGLWTAIRSVAPRGLSRRAWATAGLAALVGTLATPQGLSMWRFLNDTVGLGRADISEWQPLTGLPSGDALPWALTTMVALVGLVRATERRASHVAVVALLLVVSFNV